MEAFASVPGIVLLLLVLGGTIVLRYKRYIRRRPAYISIGVICALLLYTAYALSRVTV